MHDFIFAGGGLASCLTAYRLVQRFPDLDVLVVERGARLGGNHTWSFFATDVTPAAAAWLEPLIAHRWPSYEVRFPALERRLDTGYRSMTSEHLDACVQKALGPRRLRLDTAIAGVAAREVTLADGETLRGRCVIDGRGPEPTEHLHLGFQKFTGRVLTLGAPHGLEGPIIMDATVAQDGDYRFIYVLPIATDVVLVEDTRYSDVAEVDRRADREAIHAYAETQGWRVSGMDREEAGVLPITLGGDLDAFWQDAGEVPRIGLRAALFHATTGYSLPDAVRLADAIAGRRDWTSPALARFIRHYAQQHWRSQGFLRLLNRMLFLAAEPERRVVVMQRFYGLPQGLIERFYRGTPTLADRFRILTGKPPVAIGPALACLPPTSSKRILERQSP